MNERKRWAALSVVLAFVTGGEALAATFQGLGLASGFPQSSAAYGISADGSVIVGQVVDSLSNPQAAHWTQANGWASIDSPGGVSTAQAASSNGSVIVGSHAVVDFEAFRWTQTGGLVGLGYLPMAWDPDSEAWAVSSDGSVVVGGSFIATVGANEAFRWTKAGGMVGLGHLTSPGYPFPTSTAYGVSGDGAFVVGQSLTDSLHAGAFRWDQTYGMISLGTLSGDTDSVANAISSNGQVIVGQSYTTSAGQAFRWTLANWEVGLGTLPGKAFSTATAVNADGSVIGGSSYSLFDQSDAQPVLWDASHGMRSLHDILVNNYGLQTSLTGWTLNGTVAGISANGRTLTGAAIDPLGHTEAWRVLLNAPGDANDDGKVDGADYTVWADHFGKSSSLFSKGDFNSDGKVDGADYTIWADHFGLQPIPEPSTLALAALGAAALVAAGGVHRRWGSRTGSQKP